MPAHSAYFIVERMPEALSGIKREICCGGTGSIRQTGEDCLSLAAANKEREF